MQTESLREVSTHPYSSPNLPGPRLARLPIDISLRWLDFTARFASTGGLVAGHDLTERMHERWLATGFMPADADPVRCLARWIVSGHILSIESPWGRLMPMFQFDPTTGTPYPCMQRLLGVLRPVLDEADTALWFVTPNHWIKDECPAQAMHRSLPQALMAARLDRHLVSGGDERWRA